MPLLKDLKLTLKAPKACRLDDIDQAMESYQAGDEMTLRFSGRKPWIRFWGLDAQDLQPNEEIVDLLKENYIVLIPFKLC